MEIWKNVKGYDSYQVSNYGRVRRLSKGVYKIKGQNTGTWGYFVTNIDGTPKLVHRLIAEAFIPNPDNKLEVNHINGDKLDNLPSNLEWVTFSENKIHAIQTGLNDYTKNKMKKVAQYSLEGDFIREYESINQVAKCFGKEGQHSNVRKVCEGKRKTFQGYIFKYV